MAGDDGPRILHPEAPLQQGLEQVAELTDDPEQERGDNRVHHGEFRKKEESRDNRPDNAPDHPPTAPSTLLLGLTTG